MSNSVENRKTNPTGLVCIDRKDIAITVNHDPISDQLVSFTVTDLDLESYSFPSDSLLIIHVYSSVEELRNEIGNASAPSIGKDVPLDNINESNVTFRLLVKMPETDQLIGTCEKIRTTRSNEDEGSAESLLHLRYEDLGQRLWRVAAIGGDQPLLLVNNSSSLKIREHIEAKNALVVGLIIPQAFEQCLIYLVQHWDGGDPGDWQSVWKAFLEKLDIEEPEDKDDPDQVATWAVDASAKYVDKIQFANRVAEWESACE